MPLLRNIISIGLVQSGRLCRLKVELPDVPGSLAKILQIVAKLDGNVKDVTHDRAFYNVTPGFTIIIISIETKGHEHVSTIRDTLLKDPFFNNVEIINNK